MPSEQRGDSAGSSANLRSGVTLWAATDTPRDNLDAAECGRLALGPIFLVVISDAFNPWSRRSLKDGPHYEPTRA